MPWSWCCSFKQNKLNNKASRRSPDAEQNGLELLYDGPGTDSKVDLVAVHGLGGHRERSWTAANGVNWLRDLLPVDIPNARVVSWGYHTSNGGEDSGASHHEVSKKLALDLWDLRSSTSTTLRPIIFIAHSLGGTIVKSALLYSDAAQETPTMDLPSIRMSTRGVVFMGTPELDSRILGLQSYLTSMEGSDQESSDTYQEACWLVNTLQGYSSISEAYFTLFVHERPNSSEAGTSDKVRDTSLIITYTLY
ncbi:hypothetical protein PENARI_c002G02290 [Penicillium arizonense]|uniref:DUF676 domain-containing protein n=1 Tax=Penicillium arizonense TaxID=1835702 RepID=A0A1F5LUU5_PENAI|nr:hypothetical protein PENARI_c002G02290 [Penicillium arizonense]OGE56876.1 hypothetical protein PENARI_c002G02290 [Penicillium arizonense]